MAPLEETLRFSLRLPKNWFYSFESRREILARNHPEVRKVITNYKDKRYDSFKTRVEVTDALAIKTLVNNLIFLREGEGLVKLRERINEYGISACEYNSDYCPFFVVIPEPIDVVKKIVQGLTEGLIICDAHKEKIKEWGF